MLAYLGHIREASFFLYINRAGRPRPSYFLRVRVHNFLRDPSFILLNNVFNFC